MGEVMETFSDSEFEEQSTKYIDFVTFAYLCERYESIIFTSVID